MKIPDKKTAKSAAERKEYAISKFPSDYNCAQSMLRAFASDLGADENDAVKYATGFGSGIATGQICGAVTGAVMAIGLYTSEISDRTERKNKTYGLVREFLKRFEEKNGSTECKTLLGYTVTNPEIVKCLPEDMQPKNACRPFVESAVLILSDILDEDKKGNRKVIKNNNLKV